MTAPGRLVALETSGPVGSVALAVEGRVVARRFLDEARRHASRIVPALDEVLREAGVARRDLGGVVVGAGPGSFTGVRVAASAGKGLAHALGVPLWAVSSLEAAALTPRVVSDDVARRVWPGAASGMVSHEGVSVLFDARGRRLFTATFMWQDGALSIARPPGFATVDDLLADTDPMLTGLPLAGSGALAHQDEFTGVGRTVLLPPHGVPTADALLRRVVDGRLPPLPDAAGWEPDYLRATGAERQGPSPPSPVVG